MPTTDNAEVLTAHALGMAVLDAAGIRADCVSKVEVIMNAGDMAEIRVTRHARGETKKWVKHLEVFRQHAAPDEVRDADPMDTLLDEIRALRAEVARLRRSIELSESVD